MKEGTLGNMALALLTDTAGFLWSGQRQGSPDSAMMSPKIPAPLQSSGIFAKLWQISSYVQDPSILSPTGMQGSVRPFFFRDSSTLMGAFISWRVSASKEASIGPGKTMGSCFTSNFLMLSALPPHDFQVRACDEAKAQRRTKADHLHFSRLTVFFLAQKKKS